MDSSCSFPGAVVPGASGLVDGIAESILGRGAAVGLPAAPLVLRCHNQELRRRPLFMVGIVPY